MIRVFDRTGRANLGHALETAEYLSAMQHRQPDGHGPSEAMRSDNSELSYDHVPRRENVSHRSNARAKLGDEVRARSGDHRRRTYWITSSV